MTVTGIDDADYFGLIRQMVTGRALPPATTRVALTPEQRTAKWQSFDALATQHEAPFEAAALSLFAADAHRVGRLFGQVRVAGDPVLTPHEVEYLLRELRRIFQPEGPSGRDWMGTMAAPMGTTMRAGAGQLGVSLGGPRIADERVMRAVRRRTDRLAHLVGSTTATQVEAAVLAGEQAGWGPRQTADMINQTVFGGLAKQRAMMIARTETIGALNEGQYIQALEGGLTQCEWLTQGDDRVRPTGGQWVPPGEGNHRDLDGMQLPLGSTFPNGCRFPGDPTGAAAEVINCRCTLLYS